MLDNGETGEVNHNAIKPLRMTLMMPLIKRLIQRYFLSIGILDGASIGGLFIQISLS